MVGGEGGGKEEGAVSLETDVSRSSSNELRPQIDDGRYNQAAREEYRRDKKVKVSAASDHATITGFWLGAIRDRMRAGDDFASLLARHPELGSFGFIFEHYERGALYSAEYHEAYVRPSSRRQLRQERGGGGKKQQVAGGKKGGGGGGGKKGGRRR